MVISVAVILVMTDLSKTLPSLTAIPNYVGLALFGSGWLSMTMVVGACPKLVGINMILVMTNVLTVLPDVPSANVLMPIG